MAESVASAASRRIGWYHGWNIVGLAVLAQMGAMGLSLNCFSLFLQGWRHEFAVPVSTLSLAVTIFSLSCTLFCAVAGWAADRFPARWLIAAGLAFVAVCYAAVAASTAFWQVIAAYAALSFGVSISAGIPCQAVVSRWFVKRRGLALGISAFGVASAGVVLPPLVVVMVRQLGWRETWWIFAALLIVVITPAVIFGMRDRPGPRDSLSYVGLAPDDAAGGAQVSFRDIIRRRNFWLVGLAFICAFCAYQGVVINLVPIVVSRGLTLATAGLVISAVSVADLVGKLGLGALADRFGNRIPLAGLCLLGAVAALVMAFSHAAAALIAGLLAMGFVGAIWTLLASATAAEFGQRGFGRAFGLISTFTPFGSIAPPVLAWTQERTGAYASGLVGLAVVALVGAGLALAMKAQPNQHPGRAESV